MCLAASLVFNTPFPCTGEFTEVLGNIFLDGRKNSFTCNFKNLSATNTSLVRYLGGMVSYISIPILDNSQGSKANGDGSEVCMGAQELITALQARAAAHPSEPS